ncbi:MAG: IucA/IucC family protein [Parachlamydiaceae bacterium]
MNVDQAYVGYRTLVPGLTAADQSFDKPATADRLFAFERAMLKARLVEEPQFAPFRFLPDPLLTFLCGEKSRLSMFAETRRVLGESGELLGGYGHHYEAKDDIYHPQKFEPFNVQGFWIPEAEGQIFSIQEFSEASPLIRRMANGEREILLLVHPKSERLFADLMARYHISRVVIPALALSSFRTLLIAIPSRTSQPEYAMVKVSVDDVIGDVSRILSWKECAGSVAATAVIQDKLSKESIPGFAVMKEDWSFALKEVGLKGAGMIHRVIPECLLNPDSKEHVIPLFALFGGKNRELLDLLIRQSQKSPTQFVVDFLLAPLADIFIEMLYTKDVSLELHGQNVLLVIDTANPHDLKISFLYRDMGGVTCKLDPKETDALPTHLKKVEYFYSDAHILDAAHVLELMSQKITFNLTKQFFKSPDYDQMDPPFARWKNEMVRRGFSENWTVQGEDGDAHQTSFAKDRFFRYGYFGKLFGKCVLEALSRQGVFVMRPTPSYQELAEKLENPSAPHNTCLEIQWFKDLILKTYLSDD